VTLSAGGAVRPGASIGALAIRSLTLQAGGVYEWEINNLDGAPGGPAGWDSLNVAGPLTFDVAAGSKWTLRILGLPPAPPTVPLLTSYEWVIAEATSIAGFDPARVTIQVSNLASLLPGATANRFELSQSGGRLLLSYMVPEPGAATLLSIAIASGLAALRVRPRNGDPKLTSRNRRLQQLRGASARSTS